MDTEVVDGEEAEAGEVTGVGEGTIVDSNTGKTGTETETGTETGTGTEIETETGTGGMEVGISQALQAPTRDTTPIIRDHIMTATDLYCNLSGVVSIYSIHSLITCIAIPYVCNVQLLVSFHMTLFSSLTSKG